MPAVATSLPTEVQWNATIKEDSVIKAEVITKYIIEQKFALMQPEVQVGIAEMNVYTLVEQFWMKIPNTSANS